MWQRQNPVELLVKTRLCFSWQISISILRSEELLSDDFVYTRKFLTYWPQPSLIVTQITWFCKNFKVKFGFIQISVKMWKYKVKKQFWNCGWQKRKIKLLQPRPVKSDFFLIRAKVHSTYCDKVSYWLQHTLYCIVQYRNVCQIMHNICVCLWKGLVHTI